MKYVLAYATLTITLATCATENTTKPWQSQLNENEKLAPQIVALLGNKELKESCNNNSYCSIYIEEMCRAIYNEQTIKKAQIEAMVEQVGRIKDWVPAKSKKVAENVWLAYLDFKAKNSAK